MALTSKQESFSQGIASGLGQADAYRAAYSATEWKDTSIYPKASQLMKNSKVAARVAELKQALERKSIWTREMSVKALVQAYKEGKPSEKISAVKELNCMHGFNAPGQLNVDHKFELLLPFVTQAMIDRNN